MRGGGVEPLAHLELHRLLTHALFEPGVELVQLRRWALQRSAFDGLPLLGLPDECELVATDLVKHIH